jgi:predicted alpha/beta superfamily hydrolase
MMKTSIFFLLVFSVFGCKNEPKTEVVTKTTSNIEVNVLSEAVLSSGTLYRIDSFPSEYIKPRPIDIWLPDNYSNAEKYAVLYMHDGQMLFDSTTTWNQQEWKVDEWASKLIGQNQTKPFIVVAVHNIPQIRWLDLFPEKAFLNIEASKRQELLENGMNDMKNVSLNGDNYLKFIVEDLKPFIDKKYSVYTNPENTFIAGSSMGGLMSMYAISEYPDVFSGAACLSTHWPGAMPGEDNPFPDAIFKYVEAKLPKSEQHKLYFDYGNQTLDAHYPQYAPRLDSILAQKGYTDTNAKNLFFEGTDHSENAWNKRLDVPLTFLLGKQ